MTLRRVHLLAGVIFVGASAASALQDNPIDVLGTPSVDKPATTSTEGSPTKTDADRARIDEILTKLQTRSDGLSDIRCKVEFVEEDRINLSKRIKHGEIKFLITEPNPYFLVHFARTEVDGEVGRQEWYLFDGTSLYEALERIQQVTIRPYVADGEKIDLFDLETAPFPLPFGQQKEKILRNFDVTLAAAKDEDPKDCDHLVCIPKPDTVMSRKYDKLEFFVRQDVDLPVKIIVTRNNGYEINTAVFPDLSKKSINSGLAKKDFAAPPAWKKYKRVVEAPQ